MREKEGRFKAGDMVVFRLGERENTTCPHCNYAFYNSEDEQLLVSFSGKVLEVRGTIEEDPGPRFCNQCDEAVTGRVGIREGYVLLHYYKVSNGREFDGFTVYESELSPAPLESKNEMYRRLYGG